MLRPSNRCTYEEETQPLREIDERKFWKYKIGTNDFWIGKWYRKRWVDNKEKSKNTGVIPNVIKCADYSEGGGEGLQWAGHVWRVSRNSIQVMEKNATGKIVRKTPYEMGRYETQREGSDWKRQASDRKNYRYDCATCWLKVVDFTQKKIYLLLHSRC